MKGLGFIGTGAIAAPMIRLLVDKGYSVTVTERSKVVSAELAQTHGVNIAEPQRVLDNSDTVFLCLRPHQVDALTPLKFGADHKIISVMAAVPLERLQEICAPASDFVQTIPFEYMEFGGCPLPAYGNSELLADLFEPENPVIPVASEEALNAHFSACTMIPAVLDMMNTGAGWLAGETGDANGAEKYVHQLVTGFLTSMKRGQLNLAQARDSLATDGTLSLQMTQTLREGGVHDALLKAHTEIGERLKGA